MIRTGGACDVDEPGRPLDEVTPDGDGGGVILLDQTLVCEAARLLEARQRPGGMRAGTGAERLVQLSLLLDAVLLYDRVLVVRAGLPSDAGRLSLRRALLAAGVLQEVDAARYAPAIAEEIGVYLTSLPWGLGDWRIRNFLGKGMTELLLVALRPPRPDGDQRRYSNYHRSVEAMTLGEELFDYDNWLDSPEGTIEAIGRAAVYSAAEDSSAVGPGVSYLRTLVYWRLAAHLGVPFYPSCRRLPQYSSITEDLRRWTQETVYQAVAASFATTVREVYDIEQPLPVYLPPALALFLERLRDGAEPGPAVLDLRREHRRLRAALADLPSARRGAASLKELRNARRRAAAALTQLDTGPRAGMGQQGALDRIVDLAPEIAKVAVNPLDITAYQAALVKAPVDWLRTWWLRRPYRPVFRLRDRLLAIRGYDRLLTAAGLDIPAAELDQFTADYETRFSKYPFYGSSRRPGSAQVTGDPS
jgi:hypothetical protein